VIKNNTIMHVIT